LTLRFPVPGLIDATESFPDLTRLVKKVQRHTLAIGEHSDLFKGYRTDDEQPEGLKRVYAVKVLRAGTPSCPTFHEDLQKS
jgi:hypothetical protein